jgi:hypothetical protein
MHTSAASLTFRVGSRAGHGIRAIHDLVEIRELIETGLIGEVAKARTSEARLSALDCPGHRDGA